MRRLLTGTAIAVLTAASLVVIPSGLASASSSTTSWTSLRQMAYEAVGSYQGTSTPLVLQGHPSSISESSATTVSGEVISVEQETVVASNAEGATEVLGLSLLGGRQLAVSVFGPSAGTEGAILVLQPGSPEIAGSYPLHAAWQGSSFNGAAHRGRSAARLVTIGGCAGYAYPPTVIGSTFGPLVQGAGTISCLTGESLAAIVSLYVGSTHVGTTASGTDVGDYLVVNSYDPCTSGSATFQTDELWAVNGNIEGGTTGRASLQCAG